MKFFVSEVVWYIPRSGCYCYWVKVGTIYATGPWVFLLSLHGHLIICWIFLTVIT